MTKATVEFRIFKSTTSYDEYKRNVLFIDSVIQYCRNHALPKNGKVGIERYGKYLEDNSHRYGAVLAHLATFNPISASKAARGDF